MKRARCSIVFNGGRCVRRKDHTGPHLNSPPDEAWEGNKLDLVGALIPIWDFNQRVREGRIDSKGNLTKKKGETTPPPDEPPETA